MSIRYLFEIINFRIDMRIQEILSMQDNIHFYLILSKQEKIELQYFFNIVLRLFVKSKSMFFLIFNILILILNSSQ